MEQDNFPGRGRAAPSWTRSVATGIPMVLGGGVMAGAASGGPLSGIVAPAIALLFLGVNAALLLVGRNRRGGGIGAGEVVGLAVFAALLAAWLGSGISMRYGLLPTLAPPAIILAAVVAGVSPVRAGGSGSRLLELPRLLAGALVAGSAALVILHGLAWGGLLGDFYEVVLSGALVVKTVLLVIWLTTTATGAEASTRVQLWLGVVGLGLVLPFALLRLAPGTSVSAGGLALIGLWIHDDLGRERE